MAQYETYMEKMVNDASDILGNGDISWDGDKDNAVINIKRKYYRVNIPSRGNKH